MHNRTIRLKAKVTCLKISRWTSDDWQRKQPFFHYIHVYDIQCRLPAEWTFYILEKAKNSFIKSGLYFLTHTYSLSGYG